MDTQHFFPDFKPNQVLTSEQLNQLRQYLDDQTRLSRVRLTGTGIICGLFGNTVTGTSIAISGGFGISSDGYIIELKDHVYPRYRNYNDPATIDPNNNEDPPYPQYEKWRTVSKPYQQIPILELMSEDQLADPEFVEIEGNVSQNLSPQVLHEKVLVLYLEMLDDPLKSCIVTDCNNKGENVVLTVRALLIDKAFLNQVTLCEQKDELIYFPRLITYLQSTGKNLAKVQNSAELNAAYNEISTLATGEIYEKVIKAYDKYKAILNLDPGFDTEIGTLQSALDKIINTPPFNQYNFDAVRNLARAYNEFADAVCPLVKKCMFEGVFPRHLMLREFIVGEVEIGDSGKYRHFFAPSPARNVLHEDLENAQKLFIRILKLAFELNFVNAEKLKVTPGQNAQKMLGENALPHFYEIGAVEKWWQPEKCCTLFPPLSYRKNEMDKSPTPLMPLDAQKHPLHLDPGSFNFYNIEGHLGNKLSTVIKKLQEIKQNFNLEFDILGLSFNQITGSGGFYNGLETIQQLLSEIEATRKALEQAILDGVGENAELIQSLLEELGAMEETLLNLNKEWIAERKALTANCNISHLQADYLQLRSELICTYNGILQSLDNIPEIPPPQGSEGCVDFDNLDTGQEFLSQEFPTGSLIFSQNDIPVTMNNFFFSNGNGFAYNYAKVEGAFPDFGEGNVMWTNNVNLGFDFTGLTAPPNKVTFLYKNFGGSENILVNDGERIVTLIQNGQGEIAPGVFLEVNEISADAKVFMAVLTGPVQSLEVGGQEFAIDQVCAVAEDSSIPSYPVKLAKLQGQSLGQSIRKLESKLKKAKSPEEKNDFKRRIVKLQKEKQNLNQVLNISNSVNLLTRSVLVNSNVSGFKKFDGSPERGFSALSGSQNPTQDLAFGFYLAILDLKAKISTLLEILPKDVRGFNYLLYSNYVKEILEQIIRVRMFVNHLLDLIVAMSGTTAPLMRFLAGPLLSSFSRNLTQVMDFLNGYIKIRYNCFPAELATIYFHLQHLMNQHLAGFSKFAAKNPGLEHMGGVPKGGTFILVSEKAEENQLVQADFALHGKVDCCCETDPDNICLPPMARIDNQVLEAEMDPASGNLQRIVKDIDVLKNDLNLDDPAANIDLVLIEPKSRMGAVLSIKDIEGKKVISYDLAEPSLGIDEFAYKIRIVSERCEELTDTGKVILLIREKTNIPVYAGEDIAVTHQFQSVMIDVAMNDIVAPLAPVNYSLSVPERSLKENILEVVPGNNNRQAIKFTPIENFTGRDQFIYTIQFDNAKASGLVTVLVIPCCDGQSLTPLTATIEGSVFERTLSGLEGGLTGGFAELMLNGNVVASSGIFKAAYTIINVAPGTYDLKFSCKNPTTGEPTHETKILNGITVAEGQQLVIPKVVLNQLDRDNPEFNFPNLILRLDPLIEHLGNAGGLEPENAKTSLLEVMAPRITARMEMVADLKEKKLISDQNLLNNTQALLSIENSRGKGKALKDYKSTLKLIINRFSISKGEEKTAYRTLMDATFTSLLDELATDEISALKASTKKQLTQIAKEIQAAGISLKGIKSRWQSIQLKNTLKLPVVTEINKILS